jgi:hypothetical protein
VQDEHFEIAVFEEAGEAVPAAVTVFAGAAVVVGAAHETARAGFGAVMGVEFVE